MLFRRKMRLIPMFFEEIVDAVYGIKESAYGSVMVHRIDDQRQIFAHVAAGVVAPFKQLGRLINEIRCKERIEDSLFVGIVKTLQSIGEQAEGRTDEDPLGLAHFQTVGDLQRACPGRDHVIDDDDILACHIRAEKFVSDHRVEAMYDLGIILALIEHAHIHPEDICHIDSALHAGFIWADDHQFGSVRMEIRSGPEDSLDELVNRLVIFETVQRDRILDPGIMGVKSNDLIHPHGNEFLKCHGTVQGLPAFALELPAFVKIRHNDGDTSCLAAGSGDDSLEVLKMIVRRHVVRKSVHRVGDAVIADIRYDVQIQSPHRVKDLSFCLTASETGSGDGNQEGILIITQQMMGTQMLVFTLFSPERGTVSMLRSIADCIG